MILSSATASYHFTENVKEPLDVVQKWCNRYCLSVHKCVFTLFKSGKKIDLEKVIYLGLDWEIAI